MIKIIITIAAIMMMSYHSNLMGDEKITIQMMLIDYTQ